MLIWVPFSLVSCHLFCFVFSLNAPNFILPLFHFFKTDFSFDKPYVTAHIWCRCMTEDWGLTQYERGDTLLWCRASNQPIPAIRFFIIDFLNHRFSLSFSNTLSRERQLGYCIYALVRFHTFLTITFIKFSWFKFLPPASWQPEPPPSLQKLHWASHRTSYASHFQIHPPFTAASLTELLCDILSDPPLQPNLLPPICSLDHRGV